MKKKLSKAAYEALEAPIKPFYKLIGEDYVLQVDDEGNTDPETDPVELRRARDREKQTAKDEKKRADDLQTKLDGITNTSARKAGDIDALEASWKTKTETQKTDYEAKIGKLTSQINKLTVETTAERIAAEICGENAHLVMPHLKDRLRVELDGDTPKLRVLDAEGKPSAVTVEDLQKEFVANPKFKSIIIASKASGGATSSRTSSQAVPGNKKFSELTEAERIAWYNSDPKAFTQASNEAAELAHKKL